MISLTPAERRNLVQELRRKGLTYRQIADRVGCSVSHAKKLGSPGSSYATTLRASREAKRRRRGVCGRCGGETRYNGHGKETSDLCAVCNAASAARGTRGLTAAVRAFVESAERTFAEVVREYGPAGGVALGRLVRYGYIDRVSRGRYRGVERQLSP